jgi:hypothetical protein
VSKNRELGFSFLFEYLRLSRIVMDLPEVGKGPKENGSVAGWGRV